MNYFKYLAKRMIFPGLDLHTQCRYRILPRFFSNGDMYTLDAGCGNGALSYAAYRLGNRVLAVSFDRGQIASNREFFQNLGIDSGRMTFETMNLYDLDKLDHKFDQIICSETIEHIRDDHKIIEHFFRVLKPGGILHLCAPYSGHFEHALGRTNNPEDGEHVRDGYTMDSYKKLLESRGFEIIESAGVGAPIIVALDRFLRNVRAKYGRVAGLLFFVLLWPLLLCDNINPKIPYSLYVRARKSR